MEHLKAMRMTAAITFGAVVAAGAEGGDMVKYPLVDGAIPKSLTGTPGDPANGKKVAIAGNQGSRLARHVTPVPEEQFHGEVGTPLPGVLPHRRSASGAEEMARQDGSVGPGGRGRGGVPDDPQRQVTRSTV